MIKYHMHYPIFMACTGAAVTIIITSYHISFLNSTVYPAVISTPTEGQVCLSDDQRQNILNEIRSDIRSILGKSNSTTVTFTTG